jgi:hypothetical protein
MDKHSHPIYGLARFAMMLVLLAFALWLFASEFDETEVKAMGTFVALVIGALGAERLGQIRERLAGKK